MSLKKDIVWRVAVIYIALVVLALTIIIKIFQLQFIKQSQYEVKDDKRERVETIQPARGEILAEDGRKLSVSLPVYEIRIDLACEGLTNEIFRSNIDSLALCLSKLFGDKSKHAYKKELMDARAKNRRYHLVKRNVSYEELQIAKTFPIFRRGRYKGGVRYIQKSKRFLPHDELARRTIGYVYKTGENYSGVGLEMAYNEVLKGKEGVMIMRKTSGNEWMPVKDANEVDPENGKDIYTTINMELQDLAHSALKRQLVKHEAHHGTVVLMEVSTGAVKAIVNLKRNKSGQYEEDYNYAVGFRSEPGSTFKLASMLVALEDGVIDIHDTINTGKGKIKIYDVEIRDEKKGGYGKIPVKEVFEHSSNVGIASIIYDNYRTSEQKYVDRLYSIGLNNKLGIKIQGEPSPVIKYPKSENWWGNSLAWMAIGYEVELTPLQILTFYNAVANNGVMVKPKFVNEVRYQGKTIEKFDTKILNPSICSSATLKKLRMLLEGVVENGTAKNLQNDFIKIAGKTGTAQINYSGNRENMKHQASFAGYFPADKPMFSCIVVINAPSKDVYYGNQVAGPVFLEIAKKVYSTSIEMHDGLTRPPKGVIAEAPFSKIGYKQELEHVFAQLGVRSNGKEVLDDWVVTSSRDSLVQYKPMTIKKDRVPFVKEMGAKDAVYLLENMGMRVEVKGRGKVVGQSLKPGSVFEKGDKITLEMSFL